MELKELTIKDLLSNYKLVIPEIQREYVWGSNKTVLAKFFSELNESLSKSEYSGSLGIESQNSIPVLKKQLENALSQVNNLYETNIGFLYSYDAGNDEHYIIDGQQRLTTIVLLLYFYYVKEGKNADFKSLLNTSGTFMNFSYRVRPLTEQFLINLFNDEWITEESFKNLQNSKWYVSDYDGDTTISSICKLYEWISDKDNANRFSNLNYVSLLNRVKFYYFDVQQTSQGEELYITMNSRGEQLKDNEQIKPYILEKCTDKTSAAKEWESWEEFFFKRLPSKDEENVKQIDVAIENIIKIALELNTCGEHDKLNAAEDSKFISFEKIKKIYERISELIVSTKDEINNLEILSFLFSKNRKGKERNLFAIESIIKMLQLGYKLENENDAKNIHRMLRLVRNSLTYDVMNHVPLLNFLAALNKSENIYNFIFEKSKENPALIEGVFVKGSNEEELDKIEAILDENVEKVSESKIEEAESLNVFNGKIHLLYRDSSRKVTWEQFDKKLSKAKEYFSISDKNHPIKKDKFDKFLYSFIMSFDNWWQLANKFLFQNDSEWQSILTDYNYLIPLNHVLLDEDDSPKMELDDNTEPVYSFFSDKDNLERIINEGLNRRVVFDNRYGWIIWKHNAHNGFKDAIIFKGMKIRNTFLIKLLDGKIITLVDDNVRIGNFFKDLDVQFKVNEKEFVWTYQNEIKSVESGKLIFNSDFLSEYTEEKLEEIKNKLTCTN